MVKKTAKLKWCIAFVTFAAVYFVYLSYSFYHRYSLQLRTYESELSANLPMRVDRWHNIGIRLTGEAEYCFFPENVLNSEILKFCDGSPYLPENKSGKALVIKQANSSKLLFIVQTDTLYVEMKDFGIHK